MTLGSPLDNFTTVVANKQVSGRGQMQTKWISEAGKNLTFSVFCSFGNLLVLNQKYLNFAVSVSVFKAISKLDIPKLAIKWPNDILADKHKICGILIENMLMKDKIRSSIIGVGLNVNQEFFPADIPNATSIKNIIKKEINLEELLNAILDELQKNIQLLEMQKYTQLEKKYLSVLYKKEVPSMFKNTQNTLFMGKIIGISQNGKLQIELENETVQEFGLKEVSFV